MAAPLRHVKKACKDQGTCAKCGIGLPEGSEYRYYRPGFRSKEKIRVCMKPECTPAGSDLDQSKMSAALAAQEAALQAIDLAESIADVQNALDEAAGSAEEVESEYEESLSSTPMLEEQVQPLIDALSDWASEMQTAELPIDDRDEVVTEAHLSLEPKEIEELKRDKGHDCDSCERERARLLDEAKEAATEAVNSLEYA